MFSSNDMTFETSDPVPTINTLLNEANTRLKGLEALSQVLPNIPRETLIKHTIHWLVKATQVLESIHSSKNDINKVCKTIGSLITYGKEFPELHKQISMQHVKQLVNILISYESHRYCKGMFYLMSLLLHYYPESSERFHISIRKILLPLLDSDDDTLIQFGAKCYTLLIKATNRSFKAPSSNPNYSNWTYNEYLLCNSLHQILNELFPKLSEINNENLESLNLPSLPDNEVLVYYNSLERRFTNLCAFLTTIQRMHPPKPLEYTEHIFQLICRGLSITPENLKRDGPFRRQLQIHVLLKTHVNLLSVLSRLIERFRNMMLENTTMILQLVIQTLTWTSNNDKQNSVNYKQFQNVRIAAYRTLTTWLNNCGTASGVDLKANQLLHHILKDISVDRQRVVLTVQNKQHMSKKALKKFKVSQYENNESLENTHSCQGKIPLNTDLCKVALKALQEIFYTGKYLLEVLFYKKVQTAVIEVLDDFYTGQSEENLYKKDATCRLELLKTLTALQNNPHPHSPPPTSFSIKILNMAIMDSNIDISREAERALCCLEKVIHPCAPSILLHSSLNGESRKRHLETDAEEMLHKHQKAINLLDASDKEESVSDPKMDSGSNVENCHNKQIDKIRSEKQNIETLNTADIAEKSTPYTNCESQTSMDSDTLGNLFSEEFIKIDSSMKQLTNNIECSHSNVEFTSKVSKTSKDNEVDTIESKEVEQQSTQIKNNSSEYEEESLKIMEFFCTEPNSSEWNR